MRKIFDHYKQWRRWKKRSTGSFIHKLLVFFKLRVDLTFDWVPTAEEEKEIIKTIRGNK